MYNIIIHSCIDLYTIPKIFFPGKENLGTWVGFEPTHSQLRCDALPIELPSPWEQAGGKEGYTSASSWCPLHQKVTIGRDGPTIRSTLQN